MNPVNPFVAAVRATTIRFLLLAIFAAAAIVLPATAQAADPSPMNWAIDQNKLKVVDAQEEHWYSDGDEPYVGVIAFRARFGQPGSTQAIFLGGLKELSGGAEDGDTLTIPDSMGRVNLLDVTRLNGMDILDGKNPEIFGTVTVAMESDATPFWAMTDGFKEAAKIAKSEIAKIVETTTVQQIMADPNAFKQKINDMSNRLRSRAKLSIWERIGQTLISWGDADDRIGAQVTVFLGLEEKLLTDQQLAFLRVFAPDQAAMLENFDATLQASVPAGQGFAGTLKRRDFSLDFAGDGATYRVYFNVFNY